MLDHCCRWVRSYRDVRFTAIPGRPWILLRHKSTKLHTFCYGLITNPKISQGKCVQNITGNVSIGLVYFTIAESLFYPEKLSHSGFSGAMIILVLTVDASWCSVGSSRDVDCLLPAQKNYIFEIREFCLTQKHNFRHAVKGRLEKFDIGQTIHISSLENLVYGPWLRNSCLGQPENFTVMHHQQVYGLPCQLWLAGMPWLGLLYAG